MKKDYKKNNKPEYASLVRKAEAMTINRQINYGYRGTTPNYVFNIPKEKVPKNS